jgi:hypothetical protein
LGSSIRSPIDARKGAGKLFSLPGYPADRTLGDIDPSLRVLLTSTGDQVRNLDRKWS